MKTSTIVGFALGDWPVSFRIGSKPALVVIRWQIIASVVMALSGAALLGLHAATSALLGGFVNVFSGLVFALMTLPRNDRTAEAAIRTLVRAEAVKIALIVLQIWLALTAYKDLNPDNK